MAFLANKLQFNYVYDVSHKIKLKSCFMVFINKFYRISPKNQLLIVWWPTITFYGILYREES